MSLPSAPPRARSRPSARSSAAPWRWAFRRSSSAGRVGPFPAPSGASRWRCRCSMPGCARGARRDAPSGSRAAILAGLAFTGDLLFWHLSIVNTSVANATFFATTAPIWVVRSAGSFSASSPARRLAGLGLCLAGGAALLAQSLQCGRQVRSAISTASRPACSSASIFSRSKPRGAGRPARVTFESRS